jgi:hypothetical protein
MWVEIGVVVVAALVFGVRVTWQLRRRALPPARRDQS